MRLLISARDPGAAHSLLPVIRKALADERFDVSIAASGAAAEIFSRAGIPFHRCGAAAEALLAEADEALRRCSPDAVLVGLSGPDVGIDEALLPEERVEAAEVFQQVGPQPEHALEGGFAGGGARRGVEYPAHGRIV